MRFRAYTTAMFAMLALLAASAGRGDDATDKTITVAELDSRFPEKRVTLDRPHTNFNDALRRISAQVGMPPLFAPLARVWYHADDGYTSKPSPAADRDIAVHVRDMSLWDAVNYVERAAGGVLSGTTFHAAEEAPNPDAPRCVAPHFEIRLVEGQRSAKAAAGCAAPRGAKPAAASTDAWLTLSMRVDPTLPRPIQYPELRDVRAVDARGNNFLKTAANRSESSLGSWLLQTPGTVVHIENPASRRDAVAHWLGAPNPLIVELNPKAGASVAASLSGKARLPVWTASKQWRVEFLDTNGDEQTEIDLPGGKARLSMKLAGGESSHGTPRVELAYDGPDLGIGFDPFAGRWAQVALTLANGETFIAPFGHPGPSGSGRSVSFALEHAPLSLQDAPITVRWIIGTETRYVEVPFEFKNVALP